ncbi:cytochrome c oxidase subunit II [Novosphingobium aquiterrae]|uniref:Cytochrome c oxidase subunit 2 n=1 Tax=Novosphingobium aquiterrae TaxID=624388 RepID=A0ABV6PKX9_9SPHN
MNFGHFTRVAGHAIKGLGLALALCAAPHVASAAAPAAAASAAPVTAAPAEKAAVPAADAKAAAAPAVAAAPAIDPNDPHFKVAPGGYTPMKPTEGKGMPIPGAINIQKQYSPNGNVAVGLHDWLVIVMAVITVFVLALLLIVILRFNKRANPQPSKTSHNTMLEVAWTAIPVLILVVIAVPSLRLLAKQYTPAPDKAVTVKATGNQWFWTYSYPDNGGIEVISNMLPDADAIKNGEPPQLAADNRMVVPVGEPIRLQATGADVIHSFAVPSLWFKIDAVPGRINERVMVINEPGVYYGQCSELCGARHGYMPIVVEALPRDKFNAWVIAQGGKIDGAPEAPAAPAAPAAAAAAAPAAKPAA